MKRFAFSLIGAGLMITGLGAQEIQKRKEAHVNREIRRDRAQNGGTLTPKERRKINRQQNRLSRQIYRDKHNARKQ